MDEMTNTPVESTDSNIDVNSEGESATLLGGQPTSDSTTEPSEGQKSGNLQDSAMPTETVLPATYTLQLRDGYSLDEQGQQEVDALFHDMKLSPEQAQKAADEYMRRVDALTQKQAEYQREQSARWAAESAHDSEYGGSKFRENLSYSADAMKKFGTPRLREMLNQTGVGNHPEMVRFFIRVGKALRQDTLVTGSQAGRDKPLSEIMYPSMAGLPSNGYRY